jgi:hypothetical protein
MSLNLNKFLNTISSLNESINILVEDGIIVTPSSVEKKNVEYIIYKNETEFPNDNGNYITEKEAQTYDINKKAGETIIIEEVDMSKMSDAEMFAWFKENDISAAEAEQIAIAGGSSKVYRMGGKVYRFGKGAKKGAHSLMLLRGMKDVPHSICWCAKLYENYVDGNGDSDKTSYINYLQGEGYIDVVIEEFEKNWDKCKRSFKSKIHKEENRSKTLKGCSTVEDWYGDASSVLSSIVSKLSSYFNITGVDVKKKELKGGVDRSINEFIGGFKFISIKFINLLECETGVCSPYIKISDPLDTKKFKIISFKKGSNTVVLEEGGKKWVFEFSSKELNKIQSGAVYEWKNTPPHSPLGTGWKGKIIKLEM